VIDRAEKLRLQKEEEERNNKKNKTEVPAPRLTLTCTEQQSKEERDRIRKEYREIAESNETRDEAYWRKRAMAVPKLPFEVSLDIPILAIQHLIEQYPDETEKEWRERLEDLETARMFMKQEKAQEERWARIEKEQEEAERKLFAEQRFEEMRMKVEAEMMAARIEKEEKEKERYLRRKYKWVGERRLSLYQAMIKGTLRREKGNIKGWKKVPFNKHFWIAANTNAEWQWAQMRAQEKRDDLMQRGIYHMSVQEEAAVRCGWDMTNNRFRTRPEHFPEREEDDPFAGIARARDEYVAMMTARGPSSSTSGAAAVATDRATIAAAAALAAGAASGAPSGDAVDEAAAAALAAASAYRYVPNQRDMETNYFFAIPDRVNGFGAPPPDALKRFLEGEPERVIDIYAQDSGNADEQDGDGEEQDGDGEAEEQDGDGEEQDGDGEAEEHDGDGAEHGEAEEHDGDGAEHGEAEEQV
jgi:hypothetical protein